MNSAPSHPEIPLETLAYIQFFERKFKFKPMTDETGMPILNRMPLNEGFNDAFSAKPRRQFSSPAKRFEYNVGYEGGMYQKLISR